MSSRWDEFSRRVNEWHQAGDAERLRLIDFYQDGFHCHETDPERSFTLFTQGRDRARQFNEPWWVLFFEAWRLNALTSFMMDFSRALPLVGEMMVRFSTPEGLAHPDRRQVLDNILYTYVNTDPLGYRDELERGFAYLDGEIDQGPNGPRFVLLHRWRAYLIALEKWDEVYEMSLRSLALLSRCQDVQVRTWHLAWELSQHCWICHVLGRADELAGHADELAGISKKVSQLLRADAAGWIWRAVGRRAKGDEKAGSEAFHRGLNLLEGLDRRDSIVPDGVAAYYEMGGDLKAALGVRDRELAEVSRKGMAHRSCQIQIERCRLLKQLGELTAQDLDAVRASAGKLRVPAWYHERIDAI